MLIGLQHYAEHFSRNYTVKKFHTAINHNISVFKVGVFDRKTKFIVKRSPVKQIFYFKKDIFYDL